MADEILATKLILKRKFGVGHAAYYIQASSPQLFATWGTGIPFLPIDQEGMLECILEVWPASATGTPVPFSSLTEEQALRLRPCLEATLGVDAPNTGKECRSSSLTCCLMACSKNLRATRTRRNMAAAAAAAAAAKKKQRDGNGRITRQPRRCRGKKALLASQASQFMGS